MKCLSWGFTATRAVLPGTAQLSAVFNSCATLIWSNIRMGPPLYDKNRADKVVEGANA